MRALEPYSYASFDREINRRRSPCGRYFNETGPRGEL
jgi:hypothetical protein